MGACGVGASRSIIAMTKGPVVPLSFVLVTIPNSGGIAVSGKTTESKGSINIDPEDEQTEK